MYSVSGKFNNKKLIESMDSLNKYSSVPQVIEQMPGMGMLNDKLGNLGGQGNTSTVQALLNKHVGSGSKMEGHIGELEDSGENQYVKSNQSVKQTDVDPNQSVSVVNKESVKANMSNRKKIPKSKSKGGGISFNIVIVVIILVSLLMCLKKSN